MARARLVRMLAAELARLAVLGTLGALAVARTTIAVLPRFSLPGGIDLARVDLTLDWRVALVALAGCLGAMAAGTILPIVRFTRPGIARGVLAAAATLSRASMRLRATILALHVGATAVVLCASALFVQNIVQALASGPGFDTDHVLFAAVQATPHRVGQAPAATARAARDVSAGLAALRQIESLPGVEMVAVAAPPIGLRQEENLRGTTSPRNATGLKQVEADGTAYDLSFGFLLVGPGYLEAIGAPILAGRAALHDEVVLTPALARDLWGEENPLGRLFAFGGLTGTVSGVTDMAFGSIRRGRPPAAFLVSDDRAAAAVLASTGDLPLVIKARDPDTLRAPVERILSTTFPESPVLSVATARDLVATDLGRERMTAWMFSGFGLVALALAVESTFGLVAYLVAARRREFGVRMTLGATRADLVGRAVWASLAPATVGAACGLGAAVILAGSARAYLFGVSTVDVPAYAGVFLLILAGTAIAAGLAARRIRDVSPLDSLRAE